MKNLLTILLITWSAFAHTQTVKGVYPIANVQPTSELTDLQFLDTLIQQQTILLGESTHGSKEVFEMKHKLVKYLVTQKGYRVFALEAGVLECERLNRYIQNGEGDPKKLLEELGYWVWYTQEVFDLVEWMKTYNESHSPKIQFVGFDMQWYTLELHSINSYPHWSDEIRAKALTPLNNIHEEIEANKKNGNWKVSDENKEQMYWASQYLAEWTMVEAHQVPDSMKFHCELLKQYATRYSEYKPEHGYRDSCMAANLQYLKQKHDQPMVVWAHNGHVKKAPHTMGQYLSTMGEEIYVVGFSTSNGTYTAIHSGQIVANELIAPDEKCYEYYLDAFKLDYCFVDLNHNKLSYEVKDKMRFREIGSMRREVQFYPAQLLTEYDAIIHLRNTSASKAFYRTDY